MHQWTYSKFCCNYDVNVIVRIPSSHCRSRLLYWRRIRRSDPNQKRLLMRGRWFRMVNIWTPTFLTMSSDYNYVKVDNKCVLAAGMNPVTPQCQKNQQFYYDTTGYRRRPLTTCAGGLSLDKGERKICSEWSNGSGSSFFSTAITFGFALLILIGIAYTFCKDGQLPR